MGPSTAGSPTARLRRSALDNTVAAYGLGVAGVHVERIPTQPGVSAAIRLLEGAAKPEIELGSTIVECSNRTLTVEWGHAARFEVCAASDPAMATFTSFSITTDAAQLTFLSAVVPLALPLFDLEPLHASAVRFRGRVALFMGHSGAGKSSLLLEFLKRGAEMIADDAVAFDNTGFMYPGPPLVRVRADAPRADRVAVIGRDISKLIALPTRWVEEGRLRPTIVFRLGPWPDPAWPFHAETLTGGAALRETLAMFRTPGLAPELRHGRQLSVAASLAGLPVCHLHYCPGRDTVQNVADLIERTVERLT